MKMEHEYLRCGAWAYIAALDVHRAKLFGRCERRSGIASFDRLVDEVMRQPPMSQQGAFFGLLTSKFISQFSSVKPLHRMTSNLWNRSKNESLAFKAITNRLLNRSSGNLLGTTSLFCSTRSNWRSRLERTAA